MWRSKWGRTVKQPWGNQSPNRICKKTVLLASRHIHQWWTAQSVATGDWRPFFPPEQHRQLLAETGIAWNNLLPSHSEGYFSHWFNPAFSSLMLIAFHLYDVFIYLYYCCAAATALGVLFQHLAALKTQRISAPFFSQQSSTTHIMSWPGSES